MSEAPIVVARCPYCGAELAADDARCAACETAGQSCAVEPSEVSVGEAEESAPSPLWIRIVVALVYVIVGAACVYGASGFFGQEEASTTDWIFGVMGIGLAVIALLGVKESLFPTKWSPE